MKAAATAGGTVALAVLMVPVVFLLLLTGTTTAAAVCVTVQVGPPPQRHGGTSSLSPEQAGNAATIIAVGKGLAVPPQGWVIAIMTALQESGMRNLHYGDRDSLGMFQQRGKWGPASARLNPVSSSRMFYTGGQAGQPGLLDIHGWQSMPPTVAAQRVQVSAFPSAYAKWETTARNAVAAIAGTVTAPAPTTTTTCKAPAATPTAQGGGPAPAVFDTFGNPRTAAQAVAWARSLAASGQPTAQGRCAHYVALAYGRGGAFSVDPGHGRDTALNLYALIPARYRHAGAGDIPPAGALVFWRTHNTAGHVALSVGGGYVASTDATTAGYRAGRYSIVPIAVIDAWGSRVGWAAPDFP